MSSDENIPQKTKPFKDKEELLIFMYGNAVQFTGKDDQNSMRVQEKSLQLYNALTSSKMTEESTIEFDLDFPVVLKWIVEIQFEKNATRLAIADRLKLKQCFEHLNEAIWQLASENSTTQIIERLDFLELWSPPLIGFIAVTLFFTLLLSGLSFISSFNNGFYISKILNNTAQIPMIQKTMHSTNEVCSQGLVNYYLQIVQILVEIGSAMLTLEDSLRGSMIYVPLKIGIIIVSVHVFVTSIWPFVTILGTATKEFFFVNTSDVRTPTPTSFGKESSFDKKKKEKQDRKK